MAILMAALAALLLWSCDSFPQSPADFFSSDQPNALRYDVNAPFGSLSPMTVSASGSNNIFPFIYSNLFVPDENGNLTPDLATSWQFDSERMAWIIELNENARFHDGKPVTARDVKYSLDSFGNEDPQLSALIGGVACLSATRVEIRPEKTDPLFLQSIWKVPILPSHHNAGAVDFGDRPIGSGPFVFHSRQGSDQVILKANADYYGGRPSLDRVVFSYQPDRDRTWTRLVQEETDIAMEISPQNYRMMKRLKDQFYFDLNVISYCTTLLYNTHDALFADPRVRMALTHAIDRRFIVDDILEGYGIVAIGPMGVRSPYRNPDLKPVAYDPYKSLSLLQSAGWSLTEEGRQVFTDGTFFDFTLLVFRESQIEKRVARYIQMGLNEIGVRMKIKEVPFNELVRAYHRNTNFQAVLMEILTAEVSKENVLLSWMPPSSDCTAAGCFQDPEVTRLLTEAFHTKNRQTQRTLLRAFDARIAALQPGTFLFQKTAINVMSRRFRLAAPFALDYRGSCFLTKASLAAR